MSTRFMRLDLAKDTRDFEPVVLELGLPLLDKAGANHRILLKWLGRLAAAPECHGDHVDFHVCDDQGGRLLGVRCDPVSLDDVQKNKDLKRDLDEIEERLKRAKPSQNAERRVLEKITKEFTRCKQAGPVQQRCYFFKYAQGQRLVWGWGYNRKDHEPAEAAICFNPQCSQLFARKTDDKTPRGECPGCASVVPLNDKEDNGGGNTRSWWKYVAAAVMGAAAVALVWFLTRRDPVPNGNGKDLQRVLLVDPWTGPAGSSIDLTVKLKEGKNQKVLPREEVYAVSEDPRHVSIENQRRAEARRPGKTVVHYYWKNLKADAVYTVVKPASPDKLVIEPAKVTVGVGATEQLRAMATYPGEGGTETKVDLTEMVQWHSSNEDAVYCDGKGHLEGRLVGEATVTARYAGDGNNGQEKGEEKSARTVVTVTAQQYESLVLALKPERLEALQTAQLEATVKAKGGTQSVLGSSKLTLEVQPPELAVVEGDLLRALQAGKGTLIGKYAGIESPFELALDIAPSSQPARFEVTPKQLNLVVGETDDISVSSTSREPIRIESDHPDVAEVLPDNRIAAHTAGEATLSVSQAGQTGQVAVTVTRAPFDGIAIVPDELVVPVGGHSAFRVVGRTDKGDEVDLSADQLTWVRWPSAGHAELDRAALRLRGVAPSENGQAALSVRHGDKTATANVRVVSPPFRLEFSPEGPIDLPAGRSVQLAVWANYGQGGRREVPLDRVTLTSTEEGVGLVLDKREGLVRAAANGSGSMTVTAEFQGEQDTVEITAVKRLPATIVVDADRKVLLPGEGGQVRASLRGDGGAGGGFAFASSDAGVLQIDERTGAFRAVKPGSAKISVSHPSADEAGTWEPVVVDPKDASLAFQPAEIKLSVGSRQELRLVLSAGGEQSPVPLAGASNPVRLAIANPDAVEWQAPLLTGVAPAKPFEMTADYLGVSARAWVEVAGGDVLAIRVSPAETSLAPGQPFQAVVEQKVSEDGDQWAEVQPDRVSWKTIPPQVIWTPARAGRRPRLTLAESAEGTIELEAEYQKQKATLKINVKDPPPQPDNDDDLLVEREPDGETVEVGGEQRYTIVTDDGEAVAGVRWLPAFENEFVRWAPPVLTAKRAGHRQRLSGDVAGRTVPFEVLTVDPAAPPPANVPPPAEKPTAVRIVSLQGERLMIPVRAAFDDFRVEADYEAGPARDVTREARLISDKPDVVSGAGGRLQGHKAGEANVHAEFGGVRSQEPLPVVVIEAPELSGIELDPPDLGLMVGDTSRVRALGYAGEGDDRQPLGDLSSRGDLEWSSSDSGVVSVQGGSLTAVDEGEATITARLGDVEAAITVAVVAEDVAVAGLQTDPESLRLTTGETRWIGSDIRVLRSGADLTEDAQFDSSDPTVVRYDPDARSVVGVSPGEAALAVAVGGQTAEIHVEVVPGAPEEATGVVVIEPADAALAIGGTQDLRVFLETEAGGRTDRTDSASLESDNEEVLAIRGHRAVGRSAGEASVSARLPGIDEPGIARFTVAGEDFEALEVSPSQLEMTVGDTRRLRVVGVGPGGRRDLSDHPSLKFSVEADDDGEAPNARAVAVDSAGNVRGVAAGGAKIGVAWTNPGDKKELTAEVPAEVSGAQPSELRIEPPELTIRAGQEFPILVYVNRDGQERPVSADDGLRMQVTTPDVAEISDDNKIHGLAPGETEVVVRLGNARASAPVTVTGGDEPEPPATLPAGLRFIPDLLRLELGTPGASVRVVKVYLDGSEEDVDHLAQIETETQDIFSVEDSASGPVFKPLALGRAEVHASLDGLTTRSPLLVEVYDPVLENARLEVTPNPLSLAVGETGRFERVQIVSGPGRLPIDVDYTVTVDDDDSRMLVNDGEKALRGLEPGSASVTVRAVGVDEKFKDKDLSATATVEIAAEPPVEQERLVLTGPSQTTVGAEAQFRVELVSGQSGQDVTNDETRLVLGDDDKSKAEVLPGGIVRGKEAGTVEVRAQRKDLISDPVELRIEPVAASFDHLELEIERQPLAVGESREYTLWGHPAGGGPRQDITAQVSGNDGAPRVELTVIEPEGTDVAEHVPPAIVARAPGRVELRAELGDASAEVQLQIVAEGNAGTLAAEPNRLRIRVGEVTPPITVTSRQPGERRGRTVEAQLESDNAEVLEAVDGRTFRAVKTGQANIQVSVAGGGAATSVPVVVLGNHFLRVATQKTPDWNQRDQTFTAKIDVEGSDEADGVEYRVVVADDPQQAGAWVQATSADDGVQATVSTPTLNFEADTMYNVVVECRKVDDTQAIERYPVAFRITIGGATIEGEDAPRGGTE